MQFLQTDLSAVLESPAWQLTVLALVGTAALEALVAVWAAASRWHWFLRALAVWGAVAALALIRAYEPALLFGISSALTVAVICCWRIIRPRRALADSAHPPEIPRVSLVRFGLVDLFLGLAVIGISLAVLLELLRHVQTVAWNDIAQYAAAFVVLSAASYAVVFGRLRRLWACGTVAGAIAVSAVLVWSSGDWLRVGRQLNIYPFMPFFEDTYWVAVALTIEIGLIYCVLLLVFRLALAREASLRRRITRIMLLLTAIAFLGIWFPIYVSMLRLTSVPPAVTAEPNHYHRILAIANEVAASKADDESLADMRAANPQSAVPDRLQLLYDELLSLLEAPNAIVLPPLTTVESEGLAGWSRNMNSIQPVRSLGRSLHAEAKDAVSKNDLDRAVACDLANVRLGTAFSRGGTTIDYLVGMAVEGRGTTHLAELRQRLSPAQSQIVIEALERALADHDPPEIVRQRDTAYWERWNGWSGRLETVIARALGNQPGTEVSSADNRRQVLIRLLQTDLAIRLYHHDQNGWPESLDSLAPKYLAAIPADPYSGESVCYRLLGEDFVLYSVGHDRTDNRGQFGNAIDYHTREGYDLDLDQGARP